MKNIFARMYCGGLLGTFLGLSGYPPTTLTFWVAIVSLVVALHFVDN